MPFIVMLWLSIALFFVLIELMLPGLFVFLSVSVGAMSALILYFLGYSLFAQIIAFLSITSLSFIGFWRWCRVLTPAPTLTNVYALVGKRGIVTQPVNSVQGAIKIEGQLWSARTKMGKELEVGATVIVLAVKGCHVIVKNSEESL